MKSKILKAFGCTLAIFSLFCNSRATVKTTQGSYEADLVGSDANFVYIKSGAEVNSVNKSSILDISHPGKGLIFSGLVLMTLGTGVVIESYSGTCGHPCWRALSAALGIGFLGIPGIIFTFQGYRQYSDSKSALISPWPQEAIGFKPRFELSPYLSYSYRF